MGDDADPLTDDDLRAALARPRYPRTAGYDARWIVDHWMGPHALWLAEWLCEVMDLRPGMRVLDLGCGRAITSVFLAREFDVQVVAADLWIAPTDNAATIAAAGCADRVVPLRAEAHDLPFADGWFDAVVSIDAYQYFGTDQLYLAYLSRFLRPGGRLGVVVPAVTAEVGDEPPEHLHAVWDPEFAAFHTPAWWRSLWTRSGRVDVEVADLLDDGAADWLAWARACLAAGVREEVRALVTNEVGLLEADAGRTLGFARVVARRR